jgi:hypothetical protein
MLPKGVRRLESNLKMLNLSAENHCRVTRNAVVNMDDLTQHLSALDKAGIDLFSAGYRGSVALFLDAGEPHCNNR